jgi:hypothetical protein
VRTGGDAARVLELAVGDEPAVWRSVGFAVRDDGTCQVGTVRLQLAGRDAGPGLLGWTLTGGPPAGSGVADGALDGVPTVRAPDLDLDADAGAGDPEPGPPPDHANGVRVIDHLVAVTPDVDRTTAALAAWGVEARRTREAGRGRVQRFFRLGDVILELLGPADPAGDGPTRLWGLAFTVADIDATARSLAGRIGDTKDAVQPGRRIATLHAGDEVSVPVAFMSADARRGSGQGSR